MRLTGFVSSCEHGYGRSAADQDENNQATKVVTKFDESAVAHQASNSVWKQAIYQGTVMSRMLQSYRTNGFIGLTNHRGLVIILEDSGCTKAYLVVSAVSHDDSLASVIMKVTPNAKNQIVTRRTILSNIEEFMPIVSRLHHTCMTFDPSQEYQRVSFSYNFNCRVPQYSMSNAKLNMSLDEIIKMSKKKVEGKPAGRRVNNAGRKVVQGKNVRARGALLQKRNVVNRNIGGQAKSGLTNAATKKLVQKLVKKALNNRLARGGGSVAAARGGRVARTGSVLNRVANRSRVIGGGRVIRSPIVQRVAPARRGRGRGFTNTVFADELSQPVRIIERVQAPIIVERAAPRRFNQRFVNQGRRNVVQPVRQRVITQQVRRVVAQPVRQRVVSQPIRQRVVAQPVRQRIITQPQRERVIYVDRPGPSVQQRIQRRPIRRRAEVVEYVEARNNKNANFRRAMGINQGQRRGGRQVDRFESSAATFIQGNVVRRGRGFRNSF